MTQENHTENSIHAIFEEKFHLLTDEFDKKCNDEKITTSIIIAIHPELEDPIIYAKGHDYDVAVMINKVYKVIRNQITNELN